MAGAGMVVDTNIFIEHLRARDKTSTILFGLAGTTQFVSAITVFELYAGATSPPKIFDVESVLQGVTILPFGVDEARKSAELRLQLSASRIGVPDVRDLFIAATCLVHGQSLLTRNLKHFARIPLLQIINP